MDFRKRFERELRAAASTLVPLKQLALDLRKSRQEEQPRELGIEYLAASAELGIRGEIALLAGDETGWGLLAAARRARCLAFFLAPSVSSSHRAALAVLESLQWRQENTAVALAALMIRGYAGNWHVSGPMVPSKTEIESLAFELLLRTAPNHDLAVARANLELVALSDFAGAAGTVPLTGEALTLAFEEAFDAHAQLCRDSGVIPQGARLSAAPVYACLASRSFLHLEIPGPEHPINHTLHIPPFNSFMDYLDYPLDDRVAHELELGSELASGAGFE